MIKTEFMNIYEELNALNEDLNKVIYYHGTPYKKAADSISKNGLNASLAEITNGGQGDMQSMSGVSYLAKDKWNAVRYACMNQDEEYGYVFKFEVSIEDLLPDEDTLGSLLWHNLNKSEYQSILNKLNKDLLVELKNDKQGNFKLFADVGKYLIPKLSTEEIELIVNNTDTASTKVNLKPVKRYKFKKIVPQFKDKNKYLDDEEQARVNFIEESFSLNEAVSPEAKAFYDSLKNRGPVDTESFIKAFKKDIPANIWDQLFDTNMKLKHRGTYGIIKTGNLSVDVTAALKKYWAFQFASSVTWFETTTMVAKQEEAKKKQEEEKLAKVKIYTEKAERVLSLIDKKAAQKLLQLSKEVEPEKAKDITEIPEIYVKPPVVGIEFYKFFIYVYNGTYGRSETEPTEQELVDKFNSNVSHYIATLEAVKAEILAKQTRQEKYKNAKWYSEEFEEWASANKEGVFLFQLPDDEGIQRLTKLSWDIIERCHFTDDVELIAVVTDYKPSKRNPNSATENSYYYKYYSVNSKANPADLEDEGILLDPSKFVDDSSWGRKTYEEVSVESAKRSPSRYFIPGMDKWFEYESESYSTD